MDTLIPIAERIAQRLTARGERVGVAESSAGGLISAALLAVPGASAYFVAGGVVYTPRARATLMGLAKEDVAGVRSASEPYALILARTACNRFGTDWGLSETGAAGPTGNPYGDAAGHTCIALVGPGAEIALTVETGERDRVGNMRVFAREALLLLERGLIAAG
ncbi:MAG: nicotinamide-nucleotide amidohydrolase family protein [Alphaproteobacteria bacterium]|nr:nicotinamide-nucleotide amidohydrolase family protein [Alphaproteobacteria bacterium]